MIMKRYIPPWSWQFPLIFIFVILTGCTPFSDEVATTREVPSGNKITIYPPSPTSIPFDLFGEEVNDPIFFMRAEKLLLESTELFIPEDPITSLSMEEIEELVGFVPLIPSTLPTGFVLAETKAYPNERSIYQCFDGQINTQGMVRARFCIIQQKEEFLKPIGHDAEILSTEFSNQYVEFTHGGWLAKGESRGGETQYQWTDGMIDSLTMRTVRNGLFMEVWYVGSCANKGCLSLIDLISLAQQMFAGGAKSDSSTRSIGATNLTNPPDQDLGMEVIGAKRLGANYAQVTFCFELPSELDWVPGRLLDDVTLSDGTQVVPMRNLRLVELKAESDGKPSKRCDNLHFDLSADFRSDEYTLMIQRLAASLPMEPDWEDLLQRLEDANTGIVIEPLVDGEGLGFGLISRPDELTDLEAHNIVVGMAPPVVIGPWIFAVHFEE